MIYDLSLLNFEEEITSQLKYQHSLMTEQLLKEKSFLNAINKEYVTLYHGTSVENLNGILLNGFLIREKSNISNFKEDIESNKNLIYLTNKWHYFYAFNAYLNSSKEDKMNYFDLPCYVEVKVPKYLLVEDEDFFFSLYVKNKLKKCIKQNKRYLELSWEESLAQYGTVAVLGDIDRKYLVSFTILADMDILYTNFISENSQYQKELANWAKGKGKGKLKSMELVALEDSPKNITYWMKDVPEGHIIREIFLNPKTNMLLYKLEMR